MGIEIQPSIEVKLLGVVFDQKLNFRAHAARAAKRGEKVALALKRLQGIQPKTAR